VVVRSTVIYQSNHKFPPLRTWGYKTSSIRYTISLKITWSSRENCGFGLTHSFDAVQLPSWHGLIPWH
jgi:hypothetical protein